MNKVHEYSVCRVSVTFQASTTASDIVDRLETFGSMTVEYPDTVTIRETKVVKFSNREPISVDVAADRR